MVKVRKLKWDAWNEAHIARHGVSRDEVEEVCHNDPESDEAKEGRIMLIGATRSARMLSVVLDPEPEPEVYYPVTARPTSRKERRYYMEKKGGGEERNDKAA
jgi:uncharacterized DUF497 family protein